jgi:hypothetical protein
MSNITVHERGCDCLRPRTEVLLERREESRPSWMDQDCEARWEHDESVALEMADGSVAEVVPGTTKTEYGVRCSADNYVAWWGVYTEEDARERMTETEAKCEWPHLMVSREVPSWRTS